MRFIDEINQTKRCSKCHRWRPFEMFYSTNDRLYSSCKCCLMKERGTDKKFEMIDGFAWCRKCKRIKVAEDFRQYAVFGKPIFKKECVTCTKARQKAKGRKELKECEELGITKYSKMSPRARRNSILRKYGLKQEDYEQMLAAQGNVCYICKEPNRSVYALHVDHNHATGAVRKLLCHRCNNGLRYIEEEQFLNKALAYLSEHAESKGVHGIL